MISKGQVLSGRYRLLSLVGEGGMALVYKAHDQELDRTVAIKVVRPEYDTGDAFRREARASARLPHPNIVTVYDVRQDGNLHYIVMEYVEGWNLKELIETEAPFRLGRAIDILSQVCRAAHFAHKQGIIHCDLKPQNVLVLPDGQAKVTDFGIARVFSAVSPRQRGKVWGTPYYVSPELISGKTLTPASDVYSVGVMFYEMLTGKLPFVGPSAAEIARQHVLNAPLPAQQHNPRIPRYVQQILDRTLAKDPASRYGTAEQLGRLLIAYKQRGEAVTQPLQPPPATDASSAERVPPGPSTMLAPTVSQPQSRPGVDWLMLLLGGLAFVAVTGLLPLWGAVFGRALGQPVPAPTATLAPSSPTSVTPTRAPHIIPTPVVPTPTGKAQVLVPNLVGLELTDARRQAREKGLTLRVIEQRHDVEVPASHIIAQEAAAGEQVPFDTEIGVVVSLGPELVTMPDLVGFPAAVRQLDLEDLGLIPTITETWSTEPIGLIVAQTPPAGTEVSVGSVVTLTVSSGPRGEVGASFADKVLLFSCDFDEVTFRPGDAVRLVITWHVLDRFAESYTVFVHVSDSSGKILTQLDRPPLGGSRSTDTWQPGEKLLDPYVLTLPGDTSPGSYWVRVGLYRGAFRLPVTDPGLAQVEADAVLVRQIEVRAN